MKLYKNLLIGTAISLSTVFGLSAQNKSTNNLDAQMPRWYVGAGLMGGGQSSSISQNNWADSYVNPLNANINKVAQQGGYNLGLNLNLAYYLGKNRNFGLGTGIQYIYQKTNLGLNPMFIEYQSTDNFGSVFRQGIRTANTIEEQLKQNIIGLPIMLLFKKQLNNRWGVNLDAGIVFNLVNSASFNAENAKFDYEAIYKIDNNNVPIYD
ncbi:MAG: outer membrane beta-barrel protein, partial [Bacteroidota bacterium]|nr:outer membrane beta-barrel protein [Bacteroidota bacterium]